MKYLFKSNLIILILFFIPGMLMFSFLDDLLFETNSSYLIGLTIIEGFIFKVNYDYVNYDHDYKYYVHRLPKIVFYILPVALNIIAIIFLILISTNFKYLLLIGLVFSNIFHILYKKNTYFIILLVLILFPNYLIVYRSLYFFVWYLTFLISSIGLAYYIRHRKIRIYLNDNY